MWIKGEYHGNFASVRETARGGLDRAAQPSLFDRIDWLEKLHAHCFADRRPLIVRARAEGAEAWLFLILRQPGAYEALANYYSFSTGPIFSGAPDEGQKLALIRAIAKRLRKRAHHLALYPVPDDGERLPLILKAFRRAGWAAFVRPMGGNYRLSLGERDFDRYWEERPGALRSTVARKGSKYPVDIEIGSDFSEALWADYEAVYAQSWKGEEGSMPFLRAIAEQEAAAGTLRLGIARVDGAPVAAQYWTVEDGTALIHKLAHIEDAAAASPGTLLSHAMFRHAIAVDGVRHIDFGTGDNGYKADWMEDRRPLCRVDLYNLRRPAAWIPALRTTISTLVGSRKKS